MPWLVVALLLTNGVFAYTLYRMDQGLTQTRMHAQRAEQRAGAAERSAVNLDQELKQGLAQTRTACTTQINGGLTQVVNRLGYQLTYFEILLEDIALASGVDLEDTRRTSEAENKASGFQRPTGWRWLRPATPDSSDESAAP